MSSTRFAILIPWAPTAWSASGRLAGRTPLSLTADGRKSALVWAQELVAHRPAVVVASSEQASSETSQIIAEFHKARRRVVSELKEIDVGLWEGLTADELSRRYPKVYKRWKEEPLGVCPPEGENLNDAGSRLQAAIESVCEKAGQNLPAIVLAPLAFRLARRLLERGNGGQVPELSVQAGPVVYRRMETNGSGGSDTDLETFNPVLEIGAIGTSTEQERAESE